MTPTIPDAQLTYVSFPRTPSGTRPAPAQRKGWLRSPEIVGEHRPFYSNGGVPAGLISVPPGGADEPERGKRDDHGPVSAALAFPRTNCWSRSATDTAKLAGVSVRRLRYWEERELVVPSIKRSLSPRNTVRLYSYQDLLALLVVAALRTEREMSLQHIRRVVAHLESRGYAAPLREVKFATLGQEIYFQHPDGSWEGDLEPDQVVLVKPTWMRLGAS
jgi:DNA-binding transcriptional MerR regulator